MCQRVNVSLCESVCMSLYTNDIETYTYIQMCVSTRLCTYVYTYDSTFMRISMYVCIQKSYIQFSSEHVHKFKLHRQARQRPCWVGVCGVWVRAYAHMYLYVCIYTSIWPLYVPTYMYIYTSTGTARKRARH